MRIGIDILGGDFAPEANLDGVVMALSELPNDVVIVLIGNEKEIQSKIKDVKSSFLKMVLKHLKHNKPSS